LPIESRNSKSDQSEIPDSSLPEPNCNFYYPSISLLFFLVKLLSW